LCAFFKLDITFGRIKIENQPKMKKGFRIERAVITITVSIGVLLVLFQFVVNRSLWRDEAMLALNIINKSHFELLKPLDFLQVAPVLFLQIEKVFSVLIPNSEYGLRLFPLISYLLSLFFFYKIIRLLHSNFNAIIFSISLFVFNATLIYYASEVKQYMTDVLVLTAAYYFILKKYRSEKNEYYFLGAVGAISIFLSNVAPIILFTAGIYLLHKSWQTDKQRVLPILGVSFIWAATFSAYFFIFIYNHPLRKGMVDFWSLSSFLPTNPFSIEFYEFLLQKFVMVVKMNSSTAILPIFHRPLYYFIAMDALLVILILIGGIHLFRKKRFDLLILTTTPFIVQLILSGLKLYPFDTRLLLYTCPLIVIISSFGFNSSINVLFSIFKIEKSVILAFAIPLAMGYFLYKSGGFPIENIELKKSIAYLEKNIRAGDKIFVTRASQQPFEYYMQTTAMDLDLNSLVFENQVSKDSIQFINEIAPLAGRVWFVMDGDFKYPITYFESKGNKDVQHFTAHGSAIYLYNVLR